MTDDDIVAILAAMSCRLADLSAARQNESVKKQFAQLAKANQAFRDEYRVRIEKLWLAGGPK